MQNIEFIKMHGLGNDFVIIDKRSKDIPITEDLIRKLSDRRTGAGCDQLITITNSKNEADVKIAIFNPSGDRAEACGNGTRCIARILFDENKNKSYDPGNFLNRLEPEKVIYYPDEIDVRAGWDLVQEFILK